MHKTLAHIIIFGNFCSRGGKTLAPCDKTQRRKMKKIPKTWYNPNCKRCPRLTEHLKDIASRYPSYHCRPVPPFGDHNASLLIVGLAPGRHGANATGRAFTGDHAGILLYETLHELGVASCERSISAHDSMILSNCRITNVRELEAVASGGAIVALGQIAHNAIAKALSLKLASIPFGHGVEYSLANGRTLISSYHCSRYNTQTKRLTKPMFREVIKRALILSTNSTI